MPKEKEDKTPIKPIIAESLMITPEPLDIPSTFASSVTNLAPLQNLLNIPYGQANIPPGQLKKEELGGIPPGLTRTLPAQASAQASQAREQAVIRKNPVSMGQVRGGIGLPAISTGISNYQIPNPNLFILKPKKPKKLYKQ